jgi:hypothetical protein
MAAPLIPELRIPVLSDDDLQALLATCAGRDFLDLRVTALLRLFIATADDAPSCRTSTPC